MVMHGSAISRSRAVRQGFAMVVVAALCACATDLPTDADSLPSDSGTVAGKTLAIGSSGAGNYLAGRFAQNHNDLAVAADYLLKALKRDPENIELLQRSYLSLAASGRLDEATPVAERLLVYDREATIAALLVAERQAKEGRWADVEATVASLPNRGLNTFMIPLIMSWAKMGQGNPDAALEALAPLSQNSNFATLHDFHAALINDLAGRNTAADKFYQSTLVGQGGVTLRTIEAAIAFYQRIGKVDKAVELIDAYRRSHPDGTMLDTSRPFARPIDQAKAGMAEALFDAAGSLRQGRAGELALIFGRLAIDLQPDFPLAQVMIADVLQSLGRLREANAIFQQINPESGIYWSAQLRVAANFDEMEEVDAAISTLERLAAQHPDRPEPVITLGDVLRQHKRWGEAIAAYDRAMAIVGPPRRELWGLYYSRGIALERDKQWARAESDLLRALELEPDEPHVLNYLGYSWIEQGENLDAARKMIEKAVAQLPKDGYIVDSLGWAFYRSGEFAKAVETLERAVELHPDDAAINDHLGDALWKVGREEEARFQWRRALIFDPEPELRASIERKLADMSQSVETPPSPAAREVVAP
jgi:tetratricopeptide (TPR) repeat protein